MSKPSTNLTLSKDAKKKAKELKKPMNRNSITNVIEALIIEAHAKAFKDQKSFSA